jgi:hypothetical protein
MRPALFTVLFATVCGAAAAPAAGQVTCASMEQCQGMTFSPGWQQEARTAGINALLGGITTAATRAVRGERVLDGFLAGLVGGGMIYAGKRIAVEDFRGAGLLGREVASVGGSVIRNTLAGAGPFEEVVLPLGPVRLYISRDGVTPRVDAATVVTAAAFAVAYDARLDVRESVSAGALVFRGEGPMPGMSSAGALMVWRDMPADQGPRLLAHERVHVLQYDQAFLSWGEGPERRLTGLLPARSGVLDYVDTGAFVVSLRTALALMIPYAARPWEQEAYLMAELAHPLGHHGHHH